MNQQPGGITGFTLKIAAIFAMTCNHVANLFNLPIAFDFMLYALGGTTFPIMAFLLVEGFIHTSNLRNYAIRLAVFAAIAQIPYSLLWGTTGNVLITLLVGLGVLWACDQTNNELIHAGVLMCAVVATMFVNWGAIGPVVIYMFYRFREKPGRGIIITMLMLCAYMLLVVGMKLITDVTYYMPSNDIGYALIGFGLATLLLLLYNGRRGRSMKWLFYAYYPLHLFVLWGVKCFT